MNPFRSPSRSKLSPRLCPRLCPKLSPKPLVLTLGLFAATSVAAALPDLPPSQVHAASLQPLATVYRMSLNAPDVATARSEDQIRDKFAARRFALSQELALDLNAGATWSTLPDGQRLGRLRVHSPGALSLNLHFDHFEPGSGGALWLYRPDGTLIQGPFGPEDARDGELWTPLVLGDEVVVELQVPADTAARVTLAAVNYGYRDFGEIPTKQAGCHIDVVCPQGDAFRKQIRSVGRFTLGGVLVCSGTLLNNTAGDFRPLFLTANHCEVTEANDHTMVVYWNYQSPTCGALAGGLLTDNQAGATVLATSVPSDFTLVELSSVPDDAWDVYYAGWDATGNPAASVALIHHPGLDEKAISFENQSVVSIDLGRGGQTHWKVSDWDQGSSETGSSGACIFDQATKRCVGTLTGGFASCLNNLEDYFGKFSRHWTGSGAANSRLSNWLDPVGKFTSQAQAVLDGADPDDCVSDEVTACLLDDRYQVRMRWRDFGGVTGEGKPVAIAGSDSSVLFWFFDQQNIEVLVKVLDACGFNDHYWVFAAASTTVEYTLEVVDRRREVTKVYTNPLGTAAAALTDTAAFETCP